MRALLPATLVLLLSACGSTSDVRHPSPDERAGIVAAVKETWKYESGVDAWAYRPLHLHRSRMQPKVVGIRVSRLDPRFATAAVELRDARGRLRLGTVVIVFERVDDPELVKVVGRWLAGAGPRTMFPRGCTATPLGVRALLCPDAWSILGRRRPRTPRPAAYAERIASPDLHAVRWSAVALPGAVCGATHTIRVRHRLALVRSFARPWWPRVEVYAGDVFYGDLDGDGQDEAAVDVYCANGGGTAAGILSSASVIFTAVGRSLQVVGIVTPRQPLDLDVGQAPSVGRVEIRRGEVIAHEHWFGPHDGDCCASGRANTIWRYAQGRLRPSRTIVVRKPRATE
jgi:hypothetical protein